MTSLDLIENSILDLSKKFISKAQTNFSNTSDQSISLQGSLISMQNIDGKIQSKNVIVTAMPSDGTNSSQVSNVKNSRMGNGYYVSDFQLTNGGNQNVSDSHAVSVLQEFGKKIAANDGCSNILPELSSEPNKFSIRMLPHRKRPIISMDVREDESVDDVCEKKFKEHFTEAPSSSFISENVDDGQDSSNSSKSFTFSNYNNSPEAISENLNFFAKTNVLRGHSAGTDVYSMSGDDCTAKSSSRTRSGQLKDEAYWERRRKNNEAAKRSRDTRRQKEEETAYKARCLAQENISLKAEINILRNQLCSIQSMLFHRSNSHALI